MPQLTGWIISNSHLDTDKFTDYVDWFCSASHRSGIPVTRLLNNELLVASGSELPYIYAGSNEQPPLPDFVHMADKDLHLARHLEHLGIRLFNKASAIEICDNKCLMHQKLHEKKIPVPETVTAPMIYSGMSLKKTDHLNLIEKKLGLPLIIKEAFGSFGRQVYWVETKDELYETARKLAGIEHLYQKPVFSSIGKDLRLNVIGGEVVAAMKRSSKSDFRANVTAGGKTEPYTPSGEEIKLAIAAAKATGTEFAGVDLLQGNEGPVVCEVNSNPHLRSIYECTGIDVAEPMMSYIKYQLRKV